MPDGRLLHVNVSPGGVPKLPVAQARVTALGVEGDRQREVTVHGGPYRAVSLLGIEAIRRVAAEGHPIGPGTTGENLTLEGFDVSALAAGTRLAIGDEVVLELTVPADPCRTIRHSFRDHRFARLGVATHPADSRMYAAVVREGTVRPGDPIRIVPAADDSAERRNVAARLDDAERSSSLSIWRAAAVGGGKIEILDDGELAVAASPTLPGPVFNLGLGFAGLPNLVDIGVEHFRRHGTRGWLWAEADPWPDAIVDSTATYAAARPAEVHGDGPTPDGLVVRELARDEVGPWADVVAEAAELEPPVAAAWRAMEPHLATAAHDHRFIAELDNRVVGTGLLHLRHRVGWLRAGTVRSAYRGGGIQRALILARVDAARQRGAELVGGSANAGGASARNLERLGFRTVATRRRYRVEI